MKRQELLKAMGCVCLGVVIGVGSTIGLMKLSAKEVRLDRYEDGIATLEFYNRPFDTIEMVDVINSQPIRIIVME